MAFRVQRSGNIDSTNFAAANALMSVEYVAGDSSDPAASAARDAVRVATFATAESRFGAAEPVTLAGVLVDAPLSRCDETAASVALADADVSFWMSLAVLAAGALKYFSSGEVETMFLPHLQIVQSPRPAGQPFHIAASFGQGAEADDKHSSLARNLGG